MSDDPLLRATRALRQRYDGTSPHAANTKRRVLLEVASPSKSRWWPRLVLIPVMATLLLSTAWAQKTGHLLPLVTKIAAVFRSAVRPEPAPEAPSSHSNFHAPSAPSNDSLPAPSVVSDEAAVDASPPSSASASAPSPASLPAANSAASSGAPVAPRAAASTSPRTSVPAQESPPGASSAFSLDPDTLYQRGHTAQFVEHHPAAALQAWNIYLAQAPNGRFAVEARYNRGVTLVRLGQREEAKQALLPFARGDYGAYRQEAAQRLLRSID